MSLHNEKHVLKLILDNEVIEKYNKYYFFEHPKAKKIPIEKPYHPSINQWCILPRIQMNALKQKWKDFVKFWIKYENLNKMCLDDFELVITVYFDTKRRHDLDNYGAQKFIFDGFTEAGLIIDDDDKHMKVLTVKSGYDKENPRTEYEFIIND